MSIHVRGLVRNGAAIGSRASAVMVAVMLAACQGESTQEAASDGGCVPSCDGAQCGDDGCGGTCGACDDAQACVSGKCVASDSREGCTETCDSLGYECGEVCGVACGTCTGDQDACLDGKCVCQPACSLATCAQADLCGGECGPCTSLENCTDCALKLQVVEVVDSEGWNTEMTLALDYNPPADKPLPTMIDLWFKVDGPAELKTVGLGPALVAADKSLLADPNTGKPFLVMKDNTHQVVVFSTANTSPIGAGRLLLLRFKLGPKSSGESATWASRPVTVSLVEREELFAPPPADAVLWGGGYGAPVVVWAQASEVTDEE